MKKLTFKVSSQKDCSVASLIKEVDKISCRIYIDLENGSVTVENVNDTMIDTVIELINKYYTILGVDIDNTTEEPSEKQETPVVVEEIPKRQPTILEPQSADDLIIKKVEFENEYVQNLANKLLRSAYWAMFKMNVSERDIGDFIFTSLSEISMEYGNEPIIEFSVGDVVDYNYGRHLIGEINGSHVNAIVCNIYASGMVYLVPITKALNDISSSSYLIFNAPEDVIYKNEQYTGGTALLDKAKCVRHERIREVVGKATPAFFEKLLRQLASTFDFTSCLSATAQTVAEPEEIPTETVVEPEEIPAETVVENTPAEEKKVEIEVETPSAPEEAKHTAKKVGVEEAALLEAIGFAFDKLNPSEKVENQVESFLTDIGMTTIERMVTQAFIVACNIKKVNYENVIFELHEQYPKVNEYTINIILKNSFKDWLAHYPTLAEKCPKISLTSLLKVFAKRVK